MANLIPYIGCYVAGGATVAAWWYWIYHKAKVRAAAQAALSAANKA